MKKICAILLSLILILSLCACGTQQQLPIATDTAEFQNAIGSYIDMSLYFESELADEGGASYELMEEHLTTNNSDLDYTITFEPGGTVDMSNVKRSLLENGWEQTEVDSSVTMLFYTPFCNKKGQMVYISNSDSWGFTPVSFALTIYLQERATKENGDNYLAAVENTPKFTLHNGISSKSTFGDVLDKMGTPWRVSFEPEYDSTPTPAVELTYGKYDNNGNFLGSLALTFNAETSEMVCFRYSFVPPLNG